MKYNLKILAVLILITFSLSSISARGIVDKKPDKDVITLTGRIKIKGSEPMIFIVLVTEEGKDYILIGEKADDLGTKHQLRLVELKGKILSHEAPVRPAEVEVLSFRILD